MPIHAGIIGLPYSGKSKVFAALTGQSGWQQEHSQAGAPTMGVVKLVDSRVDELARMHDSKKATYESLEVLDFPPFVAQQGRHSDLAAKILGQVRQCDVLIIVLAAFEHPAVPSFSGRVDPQGDLTTMLEELALADLEQVSKRIEKLQKSARKPSATRDQDQRELALQQRCLEALEQGLSLSQVAQTQEEHRLLRSFAFLTQKPTIAVVNIDEKDIGKAVNLELPANVGAQISLSAQLEAELVEMEQPDREAFMADLGLDALASERLPWLVLKVCGMVQFFTASGTESRAWLLKSGSTALEAAGKIHSDMARGFIRAETIGFEELKACGSEKQARHEGKIRSEGKDYVVRDGDVILFRFSV